MLASLSGAERAAFLDSLSDNALAAMPWLWDVWANPDHQVEPSGDWQCWVIMGGRGAGKTRAGAEWVRAQVEGAGPLDEGRCRRVALIGETIEEVRAVMVEGESGLLAVSPPDRRPIFKISQSKLIWPNGAIAEMFSAVNPEALRGPQFDCAWSDELAKWRRCRETWEMLQFCLRLGRRPRQIVTTTPRDNPILVDIMQAPGAAVTRAPTWANRANLADDFIERLNATYGGTALGRQELDGELVTEREGALWSRAMIDAARVRSAPDLDRVVVAVDPPVTAGAGSDECGIVVVGLVANEGPHDWRIFVLADESVHGVGPSEWARRALEAYRDFGADRLVAEVNQGGDLVEAVIRQIEPMVSYRDVRANRGKRIRAEPVAALYEQGRVHHVGAFRELEDQMCSFVGGRESGSPDRMDALVWAVSDLVLDGGGLAPPRIRRL